MARGSGTVTVKLLADASGLKKGLGQADTELRGFGSKVDGISQKMNSFGKGLTAGVTVPVIGFLGLATKAAIEDEAAQANLAKTLENTTGATRAQVAAVEDQIAKMTKASAFADDDLRPAFAALTTETRNIEEATGLMTTAMDLAAAKNITVEEAANLLIKAHNGQTRGLAALGIETKNAEGTAVSFKDVMVDVNAVVGGQAKEALDTTAGSLQANKRDMGELSEKIGADLLPAIEKMAGFLTETLIPTLDSMTGDNGALVLVGVAMAGPVLTAVSNLKGAVFLLNGAFTTLMANPGIAALAVMASQLPKLKADVEHLQKTTEDKGFLSGLKEFFTGKSGGGGWMPFSAKDVLGNILGFASGGTVPGPTGSPTLAMVHGGETITPPGRSGGTVINLTVNGWVGDNVALTRQIIAAINGEAGRSGGVRVAI